MAANLLKDKPSFRLFDLVALREDYPLDNLHAGEIGVLVEQWGDEPVWEVEFFDEETKETKAVATLEEKNFYLV